MIRAVLALGVTQILGYGALYYAFPILVPLVAAEFGQSQAVLYSVFSVGLLLGGFSAPIMGRAMDRMGAPRVMVWGSAAVALALAGVALAPVFWLWALGVLVIEAISAAVLYDAAFAALVRLGGPGARRDITRLTLIAGFASTVFWPLASALGEGLGWRGTYLVFAGLHAGVALPLHLWLARLPALEAGGAAPLRVPIFAPLPPALVRAGFAAVALSFALSGALIAGFGVHMVPILAAAGLGAQAVAVGMLVGPAQVSIRLVDALFWRGLHPVSVALVSGLALPVAVLGLLAGLPVLAAGAGFAVLFGFGQGLASIVRGSVPLALFGAQGYGARLGNLALLRTLASAGAPVAMAWLIAAAGVEGALWVSLWLGLVAVVPLVWLRVVLARAGVLAPVG